VTREVRHKQARHFNVNEDLPDWEKGAQTGAGIARVRLFALLSEHEPLRRFFADLGRRSGVVERNAIRIEQSPYERRTYRAMGIPDPGYGRFLAALEPWHPEPAGDEPAAPMSNAEVEAEIAAFMAGLGLPWPWLARAAIGAFTWYLTDVVEQLVWTEGSIWNPEDTWTSPPPTPADPPLIQDWYWNETERPRVAEYKAFPPFYVHRGDSVALARTRLAEYVEEAELYLQSVEDPLVPLGPKPNKRRQTIIRNVDWLFRNLVQHETLSALALAEFASPAADPDTRAGVLDSRRKDVRQGIDSARRLLRERPHIQPILTLDEYERGQMTL